MSVAIEIESHRENPWSFFYEISDVSNLGPGEEEGDAYAARVDGEIVGMAVVEARVGRPFIMRVAILDEWRRQGVGSALIEHLQGEFDELYCYIDRANLPSMEMVAGLGFRRGGYSPGYNFYQWSWNAD